MNLTQKITTLTVLVCGMLVVSGCTGSSADTTKNTLLAECLTTQWATMYGTNRCSHCQKQKELFGYEAFTKINFVDCDKNKNTCGLAGVQGYPTWVFADGSKLEGTQTLDALAAQAGCSSDGVAEVKEEMEVASTGDMMTWETEGMTGTQEVVSGAVGTGN